jgi:O-antigen ligase
LDASAGSRAGPSRTSRSKDTQRNSPLILYCVLIASTLLHLGGRVAIFGMLHIDLLLAGATLVACWQVRSKQVKAAARGGQAPDAASQVSPIEALATRRLLTLMGFIVVTIPFVEWPGSVLKLGAEPFIKAVMFYFLTLWCVNSSRDLRIFLTVYVACQCFRVLEPLYLHFAYGYWGAATSMTDTEFMDRLSGAPLDIINPNGLAFIILGTLPLLFFIQKGQRWHVRLLMWALIAALSYALILTASRSGFIVFVLLLGLGVWSSRNRALAITVLAVATMLVTSGLDELQRDRYLSIFRSDVKGASTAQGRLDGVMADFKVATRHPLVGHGLGTSVEANAHYRGYGQISHNLYTEVSQELGFVGLLIFMAFVWTAIQAARHARRVSAAAKDSDPIFGIASQAIFVLLVVDLIFSFASYGLSEAHWYLIAGLAVVTTRLVTREVGDAPSVSGPVAGQGSRHRPQPRVGANSPGSPRRKFTAS